MLEAGVVGLVTPLKLEVALELALELATLIIDVKRYQPTELSVARN